MKRSSLIAALTSGVAFGAGLYAWLGVLETTGSDSATRVGLLPPVWALTVLAAVGVLAALGLRRVGWNPLPLIGAAVLLLPWLPMAIPASLMIWTRNVASGLLVGVIVATVVGSWPFRSLPAGLTRWFVDPRRAPWTAAIVAFALYLGGAWQVREWRPGGDEPHYLVITQSLLRDGDLRIENNHKRGDYQEYWLGDLPPHFLRRGVDREIYSVHAPGLAVLVLPAFALFGFVGATIWLAGLSSLATAVAWRLAYALAGRAGAAWFAWAAVALTPPFFFHAFSIFPDGPAAALALTGAVALARTVPGIGLAPLTRTRLAAHGAALAALPWLHTRYAILAAMFGVTIGARLLRQPSRFSALAAFLALPAASAAAWLAFFWIIYGTPDPSAPYGGYTQSAIAFIAAGLPGLLFDQQFGILSYAPVLAFTAGGAWCMLKGVPAVPTRRLAVELALVSIPYLLTASSYGMWWGGASTPARFAVPVLLLPVIPLGLAWAGARTRTTRAMAVAALFVGLMATWSLTMGDGGRLAFNDRDGSALWLIWLTPVVDLAASAPSLFRQPRSMAFAQAGVWFAALMGAWAVVRHVERRSDRRDVLAIAVVLSLAGAAVAAVQINWRLAGVPGPTPTRSSLVERFNPGLHAIGAKPASFRFGDAVALMRETDIVSFRREARPREQRDALFYRPSLPAGTYAVHVSGRGVGTASVEVGRVPHDPGAPRPLATVSLADDTKPTILRLPVNVGRFSVRADAEGAAAQELVLRLVEMPGRGALATGAAARLATRYGAADVFFMDTAAFMERDGFWVGAGRESQIVVEPDDGADPPVLFLRNGAAANTVTIEIGKWKDAIEMTPGEERFLEAPIAPSGPTPVRVHSASGFRPSDVDPSNEDRRRLGVWGEFRSRP